MTLETIGRPTLTPEVLVSRLGDYLVEKSLISPMDLNKALNYQASMREAGKITPQLGKILVEMKIIDQADLDQAVTEQIIQLRNALQDANQQLERRVRERTAELEMALKKISEMNELKSNFVSNISHELRTPLTHIKGYLELFNGEDLGPLSADQVRAISVMMRSTDRLERLIEDLIQFSMTDRGQITLDLHVFDFGQLCRKISALTGVKAEAHGIRFRIECPDIAMLVKADEEKINWLVGQLLDNAIKFTPSGGQIWLTLNKEDGFVRLEVRDTGIGIHPEKLHEIFEPFHQLDGSSTRKFGGTGLGLALVRNIAEAHGTVIHVQSEPGNGSVFSFNLNLLNQ